MKPEKIGNLLFNDGVPECGGVYITYDGNSFWLNKYDAANQVWHYGTGSAKCRSLVFGDMPLDSEELDRYEKSACRTADVFADYYPKWADIGRADGPDLFDIREEK